MTTPLRPAGFFLLRAPLLACEARGDLPDMLERPEVREAVWVASASLFERIGKWRADPNGKDGRKIAQALHRYLARMTSRATPFGLFAGFAVGTVDPAAETSFEVEPLGSRRLRLDIEFLTLLASNLERIETLRRELRWRACSAAYEIHGRVHYPSRSIDDGRWHYTLTAVDDEDGTVRSTLAFANGYRSYAEIVGSLVGEGAEEPAAREYVDDLIAAGLLESELVPPITGDDPLETVLAALRSVRSAEGRLVRDTLETVRRELHELEAKPLGVSVDAYVAIENKLRACPGAPEIDRCFQVDLEKTARAVIGGAELVALERAVDILHRFAPPSDSFGAFRAAFSERFGEREVPLAEALDEETGVAFGPSSREGREPTPLIDGLDFAGPTQRAETVSWAPHQRLLLAKLEEAWASHSLAIELGEDEIAALPLPGPLPRSLAVFGTVLPNHRVHVQSYSGASSARMLARFSAWSPPLREKLSATLRDEEAGQPDAVFAEIVHLPVGARAGNILARPLLREYEIVFAGRSGAPDDKTIGIADLTLSLRYGRLLLRSTRLGKEVIPRLSNAHDFSTKQLAVYQFLAALQAQGHARAATWDWGAFRTARFLPRVTHRDVVLALARWRLEPGELAVLGKGGEAARALRTERRLPAHIGMEDGDNVLAVDLDDPASCEAFVGAAPPNESVVVIELENEHVARGADGHYATEIVVPFIAGDDVEAPAPVEKPETEKVAAPRAVALDPAEPTFGPGSEWLYAKLYGPPGARDAMIREIVKPVLDENHDRVDAWFFLRYADPAPHLRLRFHGDPARLYPHVLGALDRACKPWLASGRLHRFELATYDREMDRYGGPNAIGIAESVFHADSDAAAELIELLAGVPEGRERWGWALAGVHRYLDDFRLDPARRIHFLDDLTMRFMREMNRDAEFKHLLSTRHRPERSYIDGLVTGSSLPPRVAEVLAKRSARVAPLVAQLRELHTSGKLARPPMTLLASYIHMWQNRLLRPPSRPQELVIANFLSRTYQSLAARNRKKPEGT